jgi:hypothetical protein
MRLDKWEEEHSNDLEIQKMSLMPFNREMKRAAFTEQGTCPHCGCYVDKRCTSDDYCVIKETKLMRDKDQAKMLFNMHLGVKDMFRPGSPGPPFYQSGQFMNTIQLLAPLNMEESERIAWTYPNYEFAVLFHNSDLVIFHTENGHDLHFSRIAGVAERAQLLHDIGTGMDNMEVRWDKMDEIHIPNTEGVWGAPL